MCKRIVFGLIVLSLLLVAISADAKKIDSKYLIRTITDENGEQVDEIIVPGKPPKKFRMPEAQPTDVAVTLSNVPAFDWSYGCSATSGAMMAGYYDNGSYPNMYAGSTNGGVCPMTNSSWGAGECPLSATHQGFDGLGVRGHVDDYWFGMDSTIDPYFGNWTEHGYADCTADYMGTNQYNNWQSTDGSTTFYFNTDGSPKYDFTACESYIPPRKDGCHGLKQFFESRGYSIQTNGNYSQYIIEYGSTYGFTFAQYMAEIDAGRPVLIQVEGHTMLGYGYDVAGSLVYLHDTWDYLSHTMTWAGMYNGMQHYGVGVFMLEPISGVQDELIYHESSYYICSLPDGNYDIPAYWQWFTPSGPGELLSLKFNLLPEYNDPHNGVLHLTVYDTPGGTSFGGIDVDTDALTDGVHEFDMSSVGYAFGVSEEFYIQVTFTPDTGSDMLYMYMGDEENGVDIIFDEHSHFEYSGSYTYWWNGAGGESCDELNLSAVVEYESAPEIHDFEVQTMYFYGYFLPTETRANIDFEADIKNNGTFDETSVEIELVVTDTTYLRSVVYSNSKYISLVSEDSTTVIFDPWLESIPGEYLVSVTANLTGDMVSTNNVIIIEQQICSYPTELTYDDGTAESAWVKNTTGNGFANKFTPPYIPYSITNISFHVWADTWPDPGSNEMRIMILDDDGTDGSPGTTLHDEVVTVVRDAWNVFDLTGSRNIMLEDGSFYVASISTADYPNCPGQSVDSSGPFAGQNIAWDLQDGVWVQGYASFGDEYMIRASVDFGSVDPPVIAIDVINAGADVELTWDPVSGANSYNVYSALDPNGTYTIEPTGTAISSTSWSESTSEKKFYYVTASTDAASRTLNLYDETTVNRMKLIKIESDDNKSIGKSNKVNSIKKIQ